MRFLLLGEVVTLHHAILELSGGAAGIRDLAMLESALAQPMATFDRVELYPDLTGKAAALCFSLVRNYPLIDGNKRVGHAAMETFLVLNGHEIEASVDEQERVIGAVAAGQLARDELADWLKRRTKPVT